MKRNWILSICLLFLLSMIFISCDKRAVDVPNYTISQVVASPDSIFVDNDATTYSEIKAYIKDSSGYPVVSQSVSFKTTIGSITREAITNSDGVATAQLMDDGSTIEVATITASIPSSSKTVNVKMIEPTNYHIDNISITPDSIYADGDDVTYAVVKVVVKDAQNLPIEDYVVQFKTSVSGLGTIQGVATTDAAGVAVANFYDIGVTGALNIEASIKDDMVSKALTILEPVANHIDDMIITPSVLYADSDEATYADIKVVVKDAENRPVTDYPVYFLTDSIGLGLLPGVANTDETGLATVRFDDIGVVGVLDITASIGNDSETRTLTIDPVPTYTIHSLTANPETIYADNNITYSDITISVKDSDGFAVPGEHVRFRTDLGIIVSSVYTDSSGIATTQFADSGEEGTATIEAFVGEETASVQVFILETPAIDSTQFTLEVNSNDTTVDDIIQVRARAKTILNENISDGTNIMFETNKGYFVDDQGTSLGEYVEIPSMNGLSSVLLNVGGNSGELSLFARLEGLENNELITIHPGSPHYIYLTPDSTEIQANSDGEIKIEAKVEDKYHNSVESDIVVTFDSINPDNQEPFGTITSSASTDEFGIAEAYFSAGISAGVAEITAIADSAQATTNITVISNAVHFIEFAFDGQITLDVRGTGGVESTDLTVNLFDMNGNSITQNEMVTFEIVEGPDGTTINGEVEPVEVISNNGVAVVSVNSGYESGPVNVRASVSETIYAVKNNIVVQAGPPDGVDFFIGGHSDGESMGAGVWRVQCGALITDEWGNPVGNGTAVYFSLPDDPDWAQIDASAYVGNQSADQDSVPGTAFTYITYPGVRTNEEITIKATIGNENYEFEGTLVLPIQEPHLDAVAIPAHVDWDDGAGESGDKGFTIVLKVLDGQNNPIDNQEVWFSGLLGFPGEGEPHNDDDNNLFTDYSGVINSIHGRIDKEWMFHHYECPPSPDGVTAGTVQATVTIKILGTDATAEVNVTLFRYP